jgi:hypothetical protein
MPPITRIALIALERQGGAKTVLAAIPGGIGAVARAANVTPGRVSQVLRQNPLSLRWAQLLADLIGCTSWEVYEQLGQRQQGSPYGPLFDNAPPALNEPALESSSTTRTITQV